MATKDTKCWCPLPRNAQTAYMNERDRLNPGRAYYRCGNFGLGATCSFFAWVQTTAVPPIALQPVQQPTQQTQTQQVQQPKPSQPTTTTQPTTQTTNARGGSLSPRSPKPSRAIERERTKISALTVALKTRCKVNEPELELNRLPAKVVDGELENFLSGNLAQRRRSRSSSNKLRKSTDGVEDKPSTPTKDVEESSASAPTVSSPYYSSSSPIHIPKTPERKVLFDKLNELDRLQLQKKQKTEKGMRRLTNTYPITNQSPLSSRRSCFSTDDDSEEDFYSFPCFPSLPTSPDFPFHQHKQINQTRIEFIRYEERG